jgi:hypothetical protein
MFNSGQSAFQSEMMANIPNSSMMMMQYSATFGNMGFMVQPATPGEIQEGFPSVPYLSLESLLYNGQMSNPVVAPTHIMTGSTAGTQNVAGNLTTTDNTGNIRVSIGNGSF